ncbi:MAG: hypothetical protein ACREWG_05705 [Gammaproteobacteria bacterium]
MLRKVVQDVVVPELKQIRADHAEIKATLQLTNKRLDDINAHLIDLSRRIDETNQRIDAVHADLVQRIDTVNTGLIQRIDTVNTGLIQRIDNVYADLIQRIDNGYADLVQRIDKTNDRLNRLYEVIVRRDEHEGLGQRLARLEQKVEDLMARDAA